MAGARLATAQVRDVQGDGQLVHVGHGRRAEPAATTSLDAQIGRRPGCGRARATPRLLPSPLPNCSSATAPVALTRPLPASTGRRNPGERLRGLWRTGELPLNPALTT